MLSLPRDHHIVIVDLTLPSGLSQNQTGIQVVILRDNTHMDTGRQNLPVTGSLCAIIKNTDGLPINLSGQASVRGNNPLPASPKQHNCRRQRHHLPYLFHTRLIYFPHKYTNYLLSRSYSLLCPLSASFLLLSCFFPASPRFPPTLLPPVEGCTTFPTSFDQK